MITTDATHLPHLMKCNGSRLLPDYPRPSNIDTTLRDEGNAWHWLAQECFEGRIDPSEYVENIKAYNGVLITPFMFEHVRQYLNALIPGKMEIETSWGVADVFQINGRADHIGYDEQIDTLHIDDGKYGYSIVEPEDNWTLISHAVGYAQRMGRYPARVVFTIHQPRPYHPDGPIRSWEISGEKLYELHMQIIQTLTHPTDLLQTGKHCNICPKLGNCPAARAANMNAIDVMQEAFTDDLNDQQIADELTRCEYASKLMEKRLAALKDVATHRLINGKPIPGYGLERTYKNKAWLKSITPEMATVMTGKDLTVSKLVTPTEAKARGVPELMLESMTERIESGVKIVQIDLSKKMKRLTRT